MPHILYTHDIAFLYGFSNDIPECKRQYRRRYLFFLIFSLSRSGSTALYRALQLASGKPIAYEPSYGDSWRTEEQLCNFYDGLRSSHAGVKHVWDPNGSPFVNFAHQSSFETLKAADYWCEVNKRVLRYRWHKILFLRRQDRFSRTVSDFIGQQTDLWGHAPKRPHSRREREHYRREIAERALAPIDLELLKWYLTQIPRFEDELLRSVSREKLRVVEFDTLFGETVAIGARMAEFEDIARCMGIGDGISRAAIKPIFEPGAKYNDDTIINRIPNIGEAQKLWAAIGARGGLEGNRSG